MTDTAIDLHKQPEFQQLIEEFQIKAPTSLIPKKEIVILGTILSILQVLDGVLTGIGIYHFGTDVEANPLLQSLMHQYGYVEALVITKLFALGIVFALCILSNMVTWLKIALEIIIFIYLGAAVIPWSIILLTRLVFINI